MLQRMPLGGIRLGGLICGLLLGRMLGPDQSCLGQLVEDVRCCKSFDDQWMRPSASRTVTMRIR